MYVYLLYAYMGLSTLEKELTVSTRVMQTSSNKLSTLVHVNVKCKQIENLIHIR